MKFRITTPIKAYLDEYTENEYNQVLKELSYTNTSFHYQIKMHRSRGWLKKKDPNGWNKTLEDLTNKSKCTCVYQDEDGIYIRPGSISYLKGKHEVVNDVDYPQAKEMTFLKPFKFELYDYQKLAVSELIKAKFGCIEAATGTGKASIIIELTRRLGLKTIVNVPTRATFSEMVKLMEYHFGKNLVGKFGDGYKESHKQITICINKSLSLVTPGSEHWDNISKNQVLATDEAHTFAAETLEKSCHGILSEVPYRFFVSGTQTRGDGSVKLLQSIIGKMVFQLEIEDAIKSGYLCPLHVNIIKTFSPSRLQYNDPNKEKRMHLFNNPNVASITAQLVNALYLTRGQQSLILVDELIQISMLKDLITIPFGYVHGNNIPKEDQERLGISNCDLDQTLEDFNKGKIKCLIGTSCINIGVNLYPTHNVFNLVGGSSEIDTKQGTIGRSTRKLENSEYKDLHVPKPYVNIFDFEITNNEILKSQLKKRIKYYEKLGSPIKYLDIKK